MAEIGRWNGHKFEVSPSLIRGFTGLQIKGSSETEDKESGNQKYVSRKNGKPVEVSMTIHLNARLGCDVRSEAAKFISEAMSGSKDYFYIGNKKLVSCQLMLTDATVKEVGLIGNGTWTQADVQITMKQCSKNDGTTSASSSSSSSSGSKKASTKKTSTTTTKSTSVVQAIAGAAKGAVSGVITAVTTAKKVAVTSAAASAVKACVSAVNKLKTTATATTKAKKTTTASSAKAKITTTTKSNLKNKIKAVKK